MTGLTKIYLAIAFLITGFLVGDAYGEMTGGKFLDIYEKSTGEERRILLMYISGMGTGIGWMETEIETDQRAKKVFCQPRQLSLAPEQKVNMIRQFVEKHPITVKYPVGLILVEAFKYAFPCKNNLP